MNEAKKLAKQLDRYVTDRITEQSESDIVTYAYDKYGAMLYFCVNDGETYGFFYESIEEYKSCINA